MGHKKKENRMQTVNNIDQQVSVIEDKSVIESSIGAPDINASESEYSDSIAMQGDVSQTVQKEQDNNSNVITCQVSPDAIHHAIEKIQANEDYLFLIKTKENIKKSIEAFENLKTIIQKANIEYENVKSDIGSIIAESRLFEKNFDTICLFKSPDQSVEARDWFSSLSNALLLMEKASKGEIDEKLGRVPPSNFRACIIQSSQFDPVYSIPISTPIYRLKSNACPESLSAFAMKVANSLSMQSKYILYTEQELKSELLKVLSESQTYKDIVALQSSIDKSELEELILNLDNCIGTDNKDELEHLSSEVTKFQNKLEELNKSIYDQSFQITKTVSSLRDSFYKNSLKDFYKLFNDVSKLLRSFTTIDFSNIDEFEKEIWQSLLINLKSRVLKFLNYLSIYENETVEEEVTIWNESMDFIEILDGEEDDSKDVGLISKINSIGFHYRNADGERTLIEKTKVFAYRKSKKFSHTESQNSNI